MSASWLRNRAAIAGIGHTAFGTRGEFAYRGMFALACEAITRACADAGISPAEVDGYSSYSDDLSLPSALASAFGAERLRYSGMAWGGGGAAMCGAFLNAAMAVATGQAGYVVVHRALTQQPGRRFGHALTGRNIRPLQDQFSFAAPYGLITPAQMFALAARRHMHVFGTTTEHFAEVAIAARLMAANNPDARFRDPITVEEHHSSPMIADPMRLLDICMESDVGVAVVITSGERAADLRSPPVAITAASMGGPYRWGDGMLAGHNMTDEDFASAGQRTVAEDLYRLSGLSPDDVDVAMIYDHFTPMVLMGLEDFGFCKRGESGPFVAEGNIRIGGRLPLNTSGGNLAEVYSHGMTHVVEAVRQLRGTSCNQVEGADIALVVAGAGPVPTSAMLLGKEPP